MAAHDHGFERVSPENCTASVRLERDALTRPQVVSGFQNATVLKTTQSGFANYLQDKYTLLKETAERCMATQLTATWTYTPQTAEQAAASPIDYDATRAAVRRELMRGFFGPARGGIFSTSLQER